MFTQLVFWGDHGCIAWRMVKDSSLLPRRDWVRGGYVVTWWDEVNVLRQVRAPHYVETWLQHDPELADREKLPVECRRGLTKAR